MSEDIINKLLALATQFQTIGNYTDDYFMFGNEELMGYEVSLVLEIDELLNKGYTKNEIINLIIESNFTEVIPSLSKEDENYLKASSLRILDIRYKIYMENKENDSNELIKKLKKEPKE